MSANARIATLALAAVSCLVLGGCVPGPAQPSPSPTPRATPVFASEEEALDAAMDAYAAYLAASDVITSTGSEDAHQIESHVSEEQFLSEAASFAEFAKSGNHTLGGSKFDSMLIQQYPQDAKVGTTITTFLCYDVSSVQIMNSAGEEVTPADRTNRIPLEVDFLIRAASPPTTVIARSEVWSGDNFC